METLETLGRKIKTSHDLLSVVKTMKSLAAVNIRQYEAAAVAMDAYKKVVDIAWQAFFYNRPHLVNKKVSTEAVWLVLGSDQGMCGQFNENIVQHALQKAGSPEKSDRRIIYWSAGERVRSALEEEVQVAEHFSLPSSHAGISDQMHEIVGNFAELNDKKKVDTFQVFYNRLEKGGAYLSTEHQILPLDREQGQKKELEKWPTRCVPLVGMETPLFFKHLFQQHLFSTIYKAFCQSLASENAARLASMQAAEKNIIEMEENLQSRFRETRQNAITDELLDIISGSEALHPV